MTLTATFELSILAQLTSALALSAPVDPLSYQSRTTFLSGTGAGQADMIWHAQRTITASGTEDLDLAGVLSGTLGGTLAFARIKGLLVKAAGANTNNVNVLRPAANGVPLFLAAGDGVPVQPGGTFYWVTPTAAGIGVTAGTADLITIANSGAGTPVTYDVVILGASA